MAGCACDAILHIIGSGSLPCALPLAWPLMPSYGYGERLSIDTRGERHPISPSRDWPWLWALVLIRDLARPFFGGARGRSAAGLRPAAAPDGEHHSTAVQGPGVPFFVRPRRSYLGPYAYWRTAAWSISPIGLQPALTAALADTAKLPAHSRSKPNADLRPPPAVGPLGHSPRPLQQASSAMITTNSSIIPTPVYIRSEVSASLAGNTCCK